MPPTLIPPPFMTEREKRFYDAHHQKAGQLGDAFLVATAALANEQQTQSVSSIAAPRQQRSQSQTGDGTKYDPTLDTYI